MEFVLEAKQTHRTTGIVTAFCHHLATFLAILFVALIVAVSSEVCYANHMFLFRHIELKAFFVLLFLFAQCGCCEKCPNEIMRGIQSVIARIAKLCSSK